MPVKIFWFQYRKYLLSCFTAARQRALQEGNVFSRVCLSVYPQMGVPITLWWCLGPHHRVTPMDMFNLIQLGPHCTGTPLTLIPTSFPFPVRLVGILLECFLIDGQFPLLLSIWKWNTCRLLCRCTCRRKRWGLFLGCSHYRTSLFRQSLTQSPRLILIHWQH